MTCIALAESGQKSVSSQMKRNLLSLSHGKNIFLVPIQNEKLSRPPNNILFNTRYQFLIGSQFLPRLEIIWPTSLREKVYSVPPTTLTLHSPSSCTLGLT